MSKQLEIPQPERPPLDGAYISALARLDATLAYQEARHHKRTIGEAATIVVDAILQTNWGAMHTYFEYHGIFPYIECKFLGKEIDICENAETGYIRQMIDGETRLFMDCGENFTYEAKTMKKIRARVVDLFTALALIHESNMAKHQAKIKKQIENGQIPF